MNEITAKKQKPKSRPQQWADAVGECKASIEAIREAASKFEDACSQLRSVQEEYESWKDNLSENLQSSPVGEKLECVCDLRIEDLNETLTTAIDEVESIIDEADGIDLPLGFGRD